MSILVVQLVPEGMLFGADRNITAQLTKSDGSVEVVVTGQTQRPKVLKWPNREVIVGYVGAALIEGQSTDQWLYAFIGRNLFADLSKLAWTLTGELDALFRAADFDGPFILHLGGFEEIEGEWAPRVYHVRNTTDLLPDGRYVLGDHFDCTEELTREVYFGDKRGSEIRDELRTTVFTFRQGYDLGTYGVLDVALHNALGVIIAEHPAQPHPAPTSLAEWSKHVAFKIHGYGAYFAAFYPPFEQFVGGGADVVTASWPEQPSPPPTA